MIINLGFYNFVPSQRIVAIMAYESTASRKFRDLYRKKYKDNLAAYILDFTQGRKTQSCVLLDTGQIILTIRSRKNIAKQLGVDIENAISEE